VAQLHEKYDDDEDDDEDYDDDDELTSTFNIRA